MKPALLIVDMIKDNIGTDLHVGISAEARLIIPKIRSLSDYARSKGIPIVYANDSFLRNDFIFSGKIKEHAIRGTVGTEVVDELDPHPDDIIVNKLRFSAFYKTDLDQILRRLQIDTVLVAGISTMWCVFLTAADAISHDFCSVIIEDLTACHKKDKQDAFLQLYRNFPLSPLFRILSSGNILELI